jgi:hypothetical protein
MHSEETKIKPLTSNHEKSWQARDLARPAGLLLALRAPIRTIPLL